MITHIEDVLSGLSSLPNLQDLHITLNSENDEQILVKTLPKLQKLNGSDIDRDIVIEMADNIEYNEDALQLKQEDLE
jgi:hypothetical protein